MNHALWVAKTGLDAQQTRMSVVSNNLANANTTGFKRDRAAFEDLLYQQVRQPGGATSAQTQLPTGLQLGTGCAWSPPPSISSRAASSRPAVRWT
jgi:fagellar hook-basal body proteins